MRGNIIKRGDELEWTIKEDKKGGQTKIITHIGNQNS